MYDILQLNDMLVPELLDIAEQQNITNANNLQKQELIYKILDKQAVMTPEKKETTTVQKPKRKRIAKPVVAKEDNAESTISTNEEARRKEETGKKTERSRSA